jgi:kinesin family protein 5
MLIGRANLAALEKEGYPPSRISTIVTVALRRRDPETGALSTVGKLICAELYGCERQSKQGAVGKTLRHACKVGLAVSALGNVIRALTVPGAQHVPYRDSMLTRLLQDALGGNCRTALVWCMSTLMSDAEETLSSLRYCNRVKMIVNHPAVLAIETIASDTLASETTLT